MILLHVIVAERTLAQCSKYIVSSTHHQLRTQFLLSMQRCELTVTLKHIMHNHNLLYAEMIDSDGATALVALREKWRWNPSMVNHQQSM